MAENLGPSDPDVGSYDSGRGRKMKPRLLTAEEVSEILRVEKSWVYAATRENQIPHLRLGRYVRFSEEAIEEWMGSLESRPMDRSDR